MQVPSGFDVADNRIVELVATTDLVITADIPLAAAVIEKGGYALNPRGMLYTVENIRETLSLRNFMADLRSSGVETGGPSTFTPSDRQAFANQLDRLLAQQKQTCYPNQAKEHSMVTDFIKNTVRDFLRLESPVDCCWSQRPSWR